jgi:hypothetical protein
MTVTIKINCDNAAFEDPSELSRIVRVAADRIDSGAYKEKPLLYDINGNAVGTISVE